MGRLVLFSTNVKYSENGMHDYKYPKLQYIHHLLQKFDLLDIQYLSLFNNSHFSELFSVFFHLKFEQKNKHKSIIWFLQMAQLSTTISHAQRATAFHFLTSNLSFFVVTATSSFVSDIFFISLLPLSTNKVNFLFFFIQQNFFFILPCTFIFTFKSSDSERS